LKRIFSSYILNYKNSNLAFWHTPLRINELTDEDLKTLRAYPQNYESKIGMIDTTDNLGVIMLDYKGDIGLQYNPNAIAQLALGYYDKILSGEDCSEEFLTQSVYFLNHGRVVEDDILLWEYNFPFEISVCLRAYKLSQEERYLEVAKRAFKSFYYLSREHPGGVLDDSGGHTWLEEYIVEPPNHVLNGFIWALWGVRDYAVFMNDKYAWELWHLCVKTLRENLGHYDLGFWTTYDLVKFNPGRQRTMPSSIYYQNLHVVQMKAMYRLTSDPVFKHYKEKWNAQLINRFNRIVSQIWKAYFKLRWF
jgi:hypothetical protein